MLVKFTIDLLLLLTLSIIREDQEAIVRPDIEAKFQGGVSEMYNFLGRNIKYPSAALKANVTGRVVLTFIVNIDGSLNDFKLLQEPGVGNEIIRVVKSMPKWEPGIKAGVKVRSVYNLPLNMCPD